MRVTLTVRNGKRFISSYSLRLVDYLSSKQRLGAAFFDIIPPKNQISRKDYECFFSRRGAHKLDRISVATRFPFGLIERTLSFDYTNEVLILPQVIQVDNRMQSLKADLGDYESVSKGAGSGLYGLREYTPEHSARDIHWKVSARRGNLIVREYEKEERRRATVLLDNRSPEPSIETTEEFEKAIILTASIIEWLLDDQHEVELRTASGMVGFGSGLPHLARCRRTLASMKMIRKEEADAAFLNVDSQETVVLEIAYSGGSSLSGSFHRISIHEFERELEEALMRGVHQSGQSEERR